MNTNKLNFIFICLLSSIFFFSCDNMDDIHRKYAEKDEKIYLGKVDSLKAFSGLNRVKLTWYINSDPKVKSTIIYWNLKNDSIIKPFVRTLPGIQKDSIIIENISEGSYLFECGNFNERGELSLTTKVTGVSWGENYIKNLNPRVPILLKYNPRTYAYTVNLSASFKNDGIVYSQINYTNKNGEDKNLIIEKESNIVEMVDFPLEGDFRMRSVLFFPEKGIDTLYTEYKEYDMPESALPKRLVIPLSAANVTGRDITYVTFHNDGTATLLANGGDPDQRTMSIDAGFSYGKYTAEFSVLQMAPEDVNLTMSLVRAPTRQLELAVGFLTRTDFTNGYRVQWRRSRDWVNADFINSVTYLDSTVPKENIKSLGIDIRKSGKPNTVDVDFYLNDVILESIEAVDVVAMVKGEGKPLFLNFWILNSKLLGPSSLRVKVIYEPHE